MEARLKAATDELQRIKEYGSSTLKEQLDATKNQERVLKDKVWNF